MKYLILIFCSVFLMACSSMEEKGSINVEYYPVSVASTPIYKSPSGLYEVNSSSNILVRDYLYPTDALETSPVNLIFFPNKPITVADKNQYRFICEVWKASFPKSKEVIELLGSTSDIKILPIYWPLVKPVKSDSCIELIEHYDYTRVQIYAIKKNINLTKVQLICQLNYGIITMNINRLVKQDDIILAINVWRKNMCKTPDKDTKLYAYDLTTSAKKVLGALGRLVTLKFLS